jgi:hypothetical protein
MRVAQSFKNIPVAQSSNPRSIPKQGKTRGVVRGVIAAISGNKPQEKINVGGNFGYGDGGSSMGGSFNYSGGGSGTDYYPEGNDLPLPVPRPNYMMYLLIAGAVYFMFSKK